MRDRPREAQSLQSGMRTEKLRRTSTNSNPWSEGPEAEGSRNKSKERVRTQARWPERSAGCSSAPCSSGPGGRAEIRRILGILQSAPVLVIEPVLNRLPHVFRAVPIIPGALVEGLRPMIVGDPLRALRHVHLPYIWAPAPPCGLGPRRPDVDEARVLNGDSSRRRARWAFGEDLDAAPGGPSANTSRLDRTGGPAKRVFERCFGPNGSRLCLADYTARSSSAMPSDRPLTKTSMACRPG